MCLVREVALRAIESWSPAVTLGCPGENIFGLAAAISRIYYVQPQPTIFSHLYQRSVVVLAARTMNPNTKQRIENAAIL